MVSLSFSFFCNVFHTSFSIPPAQAMVQVASTETHQTTDPGLQSVTTTVQSIIPNPTNIVIDDVQVAPYGEALQKLVV